MKTFKQYINEDNDFMKQKVLSAYWMARHADKRIPSIEEIILNNLDKNALHYAEEIIKTRWPELEEKLIESKKSFLIFDYWIKWFDNKRWLEAEEILVREKILWEPYTKAISINKVETDKSIKRLIEDEPTKAILIPLTPQEEEYYIKIHGKKAYLLNKMLVGRI